VFASEDRTNIASATCRFAMFLRSSLANTEE